MAGNPDCIVAIARKKQTQVALAYIGEETASLNVTVDDSLLTFDLRKAI